MTLTDDDLRTILGPVGWGEYEASEDWAKPKIREWAAKLGDLSDDEFRTEASSCIYASALAQRFRSNFEHEHCKATACYKEGQRRHIRDGHDEDCRGETLYSLAHADAMRGQGHTPPESSACTCGAGR